MADNSPANYDPDKARMVQLSFKRATQGLTDEEEEEMSRLRNKMLLKQIGG